VLWLAPRMGPSCTNNFRAGIGVLAAGVAQAAFQCDALHDGSVTVFAVAK